MAMNKENKMNKTLCDECQKSEWQAISCATGIKRCLVCWCKYYFSRN